jgi:hypothetical protein
VVHCLPPPSPAQYNFEWRAPLSGPHPHSTVFVLTSFTGWKREELQEQPDGGWCLGRMVRACTCPASPGTCAYGTASPPAPPSCSGFAALISIPFHALELPLHDSLPRVFRERCVVFSGVVWPLGA